MQPTIRSRAGVSLTLAALLVGSLAAVLVEAARASGANDPDGPAVRDVRPDDHVALRRKRVRTVRRKIAPGLVFTKIIDERTPRRIFILRADVADFPITYDVTLAGPTLGYRATVLRMAKANRALAAVNGDFSSRIVPRPIHAFVEDGTFVQSAGPGGGSFAVSTDEQSAAAIATRQRLTAVDSATGLRWRIDRWNHGPPDVGEIAAFSPAGGPLEEPPRGACSVHLSPTGSPEPISGDTGLEQVFSIDLSACQAAAMDAAGGVVLSAVAGTDEATMLTSLPLGTSVTVDLSLGHSNALDVMGGDPVLVRDGSVAVSSACFTSVCHVNPRTGIGVQADGRLLIVVVDGRQPNYSVGLTMVAFARLMRDLGAVSAMNLDGGGATTMVVRDEIVNRPSDGSPRHVTTAAMILPGADPGET
jgi:Phosphodiester glycosidase